MPDTSGHARLHRLRWVIWATLCLGFVMSNVYRTGLSVMADRLMADFGVGAAAFGGLVSTYFYVYTVMQLPSGVLADYLGPRRTASAGLLMAGVASFLFAAAPNMAMAYLARVLVALGVSVLWIAVIKVQSTWFHSREFAMMSGLGVLFASIGMVTATVPLAAVTGALGWRGTFYLMGAITLALGALSWLLVRDRPTDLNLAPPEAAPPAARPASIWASVKLVLGTRATWPVFLAFFGTYGANITFLSMWGVPFLTQAFGLSRTAAAGYVMLSTVGTLAGGPVMGILSDRVLGRRRLPYAVSVAVYMATWVPFLGQGGGGLVPYLGPLFFVQGLAWASFLLSWALAKEVNHPALAGIATGVVNAAGFLCAAVLQPVLGWVLDAAWDGTLAAGARVYPLHAYQAVIAVTLAASGLSLVGLALTPETRCRSIYAGPTGAAVPGRAG